MNLDCLAIARAAGLRTRKKQGNEYYFRCPNHHDEHPSLQINEAKNVWACFPCGEAGTPWTLAAFLSGTDPMNKATIAAWLRERGL